MILFNDADLNKRTRYDVSRYKNHGFEMLKTQQKQKLTREYEQK